MGAQVMELMSDFPKIECPFRRERVSKKQYVVVDEINPGYEWVFDDADTFAMEKINGTNIKVKFEEGQIVAIQNRKTPIDLKSQDKYTAYILEGLENFIHFIGKDFTGEMPGELIGPKVQGNPYELNRHHWVPFEFGLSQITDLDCFSTNFDSLERYIKNLTSAFNKFKFAEGIVFWNLRRKEQGLPYMAKLRRDMYAWFYEKK